MSVDPEQEFRIPMYEGGAKRGSYPDSVPQNVKDAQNAVPPPKETIADKMMEGDGRGGVVLSKMGEYICMSIAVVSFLCFLVLFLFIDDKPA